MSPLNIASKLRKRSQSKRSAVCHERCVTAALRDFDPTYDAVGQTRPIRSRLLVRERPKLPESGHCLKACVSTARARS